MELTKKSLFFFAVFCTCLCYGQKVQNERVYDQVLKSRDGHAGDFVWKMRKAGELSDPTENISTLKVSTDGWMPAIIPGTVLNSLVYNKIYPEPYYGLNNKLESNLIPDLNSTKVFSKEAIVNLPEQAGSVPAEFSQGCLDFHAAIQQHDILALWSVVEIVVVIGRNRSELQRLYFNIFRQAADFPMVEQGYFDIFKPGVAVYIGINAGYFHHSLKIRPFTSLISSSQMICPILS